LRQKHRTKLTRANQHYANGLVVSGALLQKSMKIHRKEMSKPAYWWAFSGKSAWKRPSSAEF
jgi:hypothetical protein